MISLIPSRDRRRNRPRLETLDDRVLLAGWASVSGGPPEAVAWAMVLDTDENAYVTGSIYGRSGLVDFGMSAAGSSVTLDGADTIYRGIIYLEKLDVTGKPVWAVNVGRQINDNNSGQIPGGLAIARDAAGNLILAGRIRGSVDFGGTILTSSGDNDAFVAKVGPDGALLWARRFGGAGKDWANAVAIGPATGAIYVGGFFTGTASFGTTTLTSVNQDDGFLARLDPTSGNITWVNQIGGADFTGSYPWPNYNHEGINALTAIADPGNPAEDRILLGGQYSGSVTLGTSTLPSLAGVPYRALAASVRGADGSYQWATALDASAWIRGITSDGSNLYAVGDIASGQEGNAYIARLGVTTGTVLWTRSFSAGAINSGSSARSVALDAAGNVYIAGGFEGLVDFDPNPGQVAYLTPGSSYYTPGVAYVAKLDPSGTFQSARRLVSDLQSPPMSISVTSSGDIVTCGFVDPGTTLADIGDQDVSIGIDSVTPSSSAYVLRTTQGQGGTITGRLFTDLNGNGLVDTMPGPSLPKAGYASTPTAAGDAELRGRQVYIDANGNNKLDPGEPIATTDRYGLYTFRHLLPGTYQVRQVDVPGPLWTATPLAAVTLSTDQFSGGNDVRNSPPRTAWYTYAFSGLPLTAPSRSWDTPVWVTTAFTDSFGAAGILDLNATFDLSAPKTDPVSVGLSAPNGAHAGLAGYNGLSARQALSFGNTTVDAQAIASIQTAQPPYNGTFLPSGDLGLFNGLDLAGSWQASIDYSADFLKAQLTRVWITVLGTQYTAVASMATSAGSTPITQGANLTLSAAGLSSILAGEGVTSVTFYRDSNNDGMLTIGADAVVGTSSVGPGQTQTNLVISTSSFPAGTVRLFAVARDAANHPSNSVTTTVSVAASKGGKKLHAFTMAPAGLLASPSLAAGQAYTLLDRALAAWGAESKTLSSRSIQLRVANLKGAVLAQAEGNAITLDNDAAGWGWFIDPSPHDSVEFASGHRGRTVRRMDLLSVLIHEVGHLLGHDHEEDGVMSSTLAPGQRRLSPAVSIEDNKAMGSSGIHNNSIESIVVTSPDATESVPS